MSYEEQPPTEKQLELRAKLDRIIKELYEFEEDAKGHVHDMEFNNTSQAIWYLERMDIWW